MVFFCLFQLHKASAASRNCSVLQFPLIFRPQFSVFASKFSKFTFSPTQRFTLFRCVSLNQRANNGKRENDDCCWLLNAPTRVGSTRARAQAVLAESSGEASVSPSTNEAERTDFGKK